MIVTLLYLFITLFSPAILSPAAIVLFIIVDVASIEAVKTWLE